MKLPRKNIYLHKHNNRTAELYVNFQLLYRKEAGSGGQWRIPDHLPLRAYGYQLLLGDLSCYREVGGRRSG